ncbi:MAG TPA: NrfD/PsrC family molybdoenzyme membrane anchor subunit [Gemmataceae bacterium]|nr:NrfD/PsrC family molybdoenzyme membrane anchor subunit [Gemmataceae bacterium]
MNLFVADPDWGWWIVGYFYLGGIAAGAYFLATLVEFFGDDDDRVLTRAGYRIAFPLVAVCGLVLTLDLERPERFWHMLLQSETWLPMLKPWSPMSIGAWALFLFGGMSFLSFVASFRPEGWLARRLRSRPWGTIYHGVGCAVGFFIASYTGVLLSASNQPVWSVSEWIGALFLASSASTGMAAVLLLNHWRRHAVSAESLERLERADLWALGLELAFFVIFLASLGGALVPILESGPGLLLIVGTLFVGVLLPLGIHLTPGIRGHWRAPAAAVFALVGGLVLRYGIVKLSPTLLALRGQVPVEQLTQSLVTAWQGAVLLAGTCLLGLLLVLALQVRFAFSSGQTLAANAALVAIAVVVAFYASASPETVRAFRSIGHISVSPEDGRPRGGGVGASAQNRPHPVRPPSKILEGAAP